MVNQRLCIFRVSHAQKAILQSLVVRLPLIKSTQLVTKLSGLLQYIEIPWYLASKDTTCIVCF